jgi:hypothetical protein
MTIPRSSFTICQEGFSVGEDDGKCCEMKRRLPVFTIGLLSWLFFTGSGCSRGYKSGSAITSADLIKALPEFPIRLPPRGTNLYLEHDSRPPLIKSWLKVAVPSASVTNFLHSFGFSDEFTIATLQMLRSKRIASLPAGLDARDALSWAANKPRQAHHAAEWDVEKAPPPLRMYLVAKPGISPNDKVFLFGYVSEAAVTNVTVYLEYIRLQK